VGIDGNVRQVIPSIVYHNTQMSMAALTMFMQSGNTPHGNRAVVDEHTNFFMLAEQALADQIAQAITSSTVRRSVEYNYGLNAPVPKVVAANVESRQLQDIAQVLKDLANTGLVVSEANLRTYIREELALPDETSDGIVTPRGMTIVPIGEEGAGGIETQNSSPQMKHDGQAQNIVIGKGGLPPGYEQVVDRRYQPAPTKPAPIKHAQDAGVVMSYVPVPEDERILALEAGKMFLSSCSLVGSNERPASGIFLEVVGSTEGGKYRVIERDGDRIRVKRIGAAE